MEVKTSRSGRHLMVVPVLAAGVELAKDELPVEALFLGVEVERAAAAVVFDFDGSVGKGRERDELAEALACLVDRVGENLERGVRATVEAVRAEDDGGAQAHALLVFELADAVVSVCGHVVLSLPRCLCCMCHASTSAEHNLSPRSTVRPQIR